MTKPRTATWSRSKGAKPQSTTSARADSDTAPAHWTWAPNSSLASPSTVMSTRSTTSAQPIQSELPSQKSTGARAPANSVSGGLTWAAGLPESACMVLTPSSAAQATQAPPHLSAATGDFASSRLVFFDPPRS